MSSSHKVKLSYKQINDRDIKVISRTGSKQTEVLVRVVPQGSYEVCDGSSESSDKKGDRSK